MSYYSFTPMFQTGAAAPPATSTHPRGWWGAYTGGQWVLAAVVLLAGIR